MWRSSDSRAGALLTYSHSTTPVLLVSMYFHLFRERQVNAQLLYLKDSCMRGCDMSTRAESCLFCEQAYIIDELSFHTLFSSSFSDKNSACAGGSSLQCTSFAIFSSSVPRSSSAVEAIIRVISVQEILGRTKYRRIHSFDIFPMLCELNVNVK